MISENSELPLPQTPEQQVAGAPESDMLTVIEELHSNPELSPQKENSASPGSSVASAQAAILQSGPAPASVPLPAVPAALENSEAAVEHRDLMEKAYFDRAKAIVEQTSGDPYAQKNKIGELSATYIRQNFGKDVKLNSEPPQG